ncbi:transporter [Serratia sp. UGAL515B_01]|uniref:transporter n=1 Tax=Serratia sp. UGAL515B_01 TaxID=2986763 RepID=UPI00295368DC|nr:transporter [Serratia sp. UGAL515B_01]WON78839.1 transporter [Serratia sp. UGAL515B_01]
MKRLLLSALIVSHSGLLLAADTTETLSAPSRGDTVTIRNSNLDLFGVSRNFGDIIFVDDDPIRQNTAPKRTRLFSGYEYENIKFSNHPGQLYRSFVIADGTTKITDSFNMGYVLRSSSIYDGLEKNRYVGSDKVRRDTFSHLELLPKYLNWVNENLSYGAELGYERTTEAKDVPEKLMYHIRPEINLGFGRNFLHLDTEFGWIERTDRGAYIETEPLYLYRVTNNFNVGFKAYYHAEDNDFRWRETAIRPLVQFRFANDTYLELRLEHGGIRTNDGSGYNYNNYALYTEIPFNKSLSLMADLKYKDQKQHQGNEWSWGNKKDTFGKVGFIFNF